MHLRSLHGWEDTATISYSSGSMEIICRRSELRLKSEVDAEEKRNPYLPLIAAWESGLRKDEEIDAALKLPMGSSKRKILKALELGYIKP